MAEHQDNPGANEPDDFSRDFPDELMPNNPFENAINDALKLQIELNSIEDPTDRAVERTSLTKALDERHAHLKGLPLKIIGDVYQNTYDLSTNPPSPVQNLIYIDSTDFDHRGDMDIETDRYEISGSDDIVDTSISSVTHAGFVAVEKSPDSQNKYLDVRQVALARSVIARTAGYGAVLNASLLEIPINGDVSIESAIELPRGVTPVQYLEQYEPDLLESIDKIFRKSKSLNNAIQQLCAIDLRTQAKTMYGNGGEGAKSFVRKSFLMHLNELLDEMEVDASRESMPYIVSSNSEWITYTRSGALKHPATKSKFDGFFTDVRFWPLDKEQETLAISFAMPVRDSGLYPSVYPLSKDLKITPSRSIRVPEVGTDEWMGMIIDESEITPFEPIDTGEDYDDEYDEDFDDSTDED